MIFLITVCGGGMGEGKVTMIMFSVDVGTVMPTGDLLGFCINS